MVPTGTVPKSHSSVESPATAPFVGIGSDVPVNSRLAGSESFTTKFATVPAVDAPTTEALIVYST